MEEKALFEKPRVARVVGFCSTKASMKLFPHNLETPYKRVIMTGV